MVRYTIYLSVTKNGDEKELVHARRSRLKITLKHACLSMTQRISSDLVTESKGMSFPKLSENPVIVLISD